MEIAIKRVNIEDKPVLRNLLELYQYDYSELVDGDMDDHGLYGYDYLDHYWTEPGRNAFFIRCDDKLAGFAMLRDIPAEDSSVVHVLSEFFVLRRYRQRHVGKTAARLVFELFPGRWRVAQEACNYPAQRFWHRVIRAYTGGGFQKVSYPGWNGPVQEFTVPPQPADGVPAGEAAHPDPGPEAAVSLREITGETFRDICRLTDTLIGPQRYMVAPNAISLAEASFSKQARFRAIYADETPVGFIMWHDGVSGKDDWSIPGYFLWRFMMARPHQGKGFAKKALRLLVDELKALGATELRSSCGTGPGSPEGFYLNFGFTRDGNLYDDEVGIILDFKNLKDR
jgi:predicted acetyltransferase